MGRTPGEADVCLRDMECGEANIRQMKMSGETDVRKMKKKGREASEKAAIRAQAQNRRDSLTDAQRMERSGQICSLLLKWDVFLAAETVYLFYPLKSEVDLLAAAKEALRQGKRVAFPKTFRERIRFSDMDTGQMAAEGGCRNWMDFCQVTDLEEFQEGAFHVMEPTGQDLVWEEAPLILTPGLSFDSHGGRIGYGKGYYDRYFQRFPHAIRAGVCFEAQRMERVPMEERDVRMDFLVTEKGIQKY